jgi:hypothetical protein
MIITIYSNSMKTIGTIIVYQLKGLGKIERDQVCRKLLGRTVKTHHGKYTHHIEGLLDTIPHLRISRGVIVVEKKNAQILAAFFKDWCVETVFIRDIILTMDDIGRMKNENT